MYLYVLDVEEREGRGYSIRQRGGGGTTYLHVLDVKERRVSS